MATLDLEVWLIGTPAELDTAARALAAIGHVVNHATRTPLAGTDAGRWRTYARIRVGMIHQLHTPGNQQEHPTGVLNLAA